MYHNGPHMKNWELYDVLRKIYGRPLETERLTIGPIRVQDDFKLAAMFNADGGDFQTHYYGHPDKDPFTAAHVRAVTLKRWEWHDKLTGSINLFVQSKDTKDLVGCFNIYQDNKERVHIAPYFLPSARQRGLCGESYDAIFQRAVDAELFPEGEVVAIVSVSNIASQKFHLSRHFRQASGPVFMPNMREEKDRWCIPFVRDI